MRGAVVSIQAAILMAVILTIAIAVAGYLYTTFYSSLQYIYVAVTQAYAYPRDGGTEVKLCFMVGGSGGLKIVGVELNGKEASGVTVAVRGRETSEVKAGDAGYVKAFFPGLQLAPGQMAVGRVVTLQGFSFLFTPQVSNTEGVCPGE
jgi:hypothetical protein